MSPDNPPAPPLPSEPPRLARTEAAWPPALGFSVLLIASVAGFLLAFHPPGAQPAGEVSADASLVWQDVGMDPSRVSAIRETILAHGNRLTGRPGNRATARWITATAADLGLEVMELPFRSTTPVTLRREVLPTDGSPAIEIFPFLPNHFQPAHTGPEGIQGTLTLLDNQSVLSQRDFRDSIGVVDLSNPPDGFDNDWLRYAQLGIKAILLTHPGGLEAIDWTPFLVAKGTASTMTSSIPINFPRAAADPAILQHLGSTVRLHLQTRYENVPASTIVARLAATRPAADALILTTGYDAWSILPDSAPGVGQATQLATSIALMEMLARDREKLTRDVLFVFSGAQMMANEGDAQLLAALGPNLDRAAAARELKARREQNAAADTRIESLLRLLKTPAFLEERTPTLDALAPLPPATRSFFDEQLGYILNTLVLEASEVALQASLNLARAEERQAQGPLLRAEEETVGSARRQLHEASLVAGLSLPTLLEKHLPYLRQHSVRTRLLERLEVLRDHHREREAFYRAAAAVQETFAPYRSLIVLSPRLLPGSRAETVSFVLGDSRDTLPEITRRQGPNISRLAATVLSRNADGNTPALVPTTAMTPGQIQAHLGQMPVNTLLWNRFAYPAFTLVNLDRLDSYRQLPSPIAAPGMRDLETLRSSLRFAGALVRSLAFGEGTFRAPHKITPHRYSGTVLLSGVGRSLFTRFPLQNAIVGSALSPTAWNQHPGRFDFLLRTTDPYGQYDTGATPANWAFNNGNYYSPQAFAFDDAGRIRFAKDEGPAGQTMFRSTGLSMLRPDQTGVNIVTFRADPFPIIDLLNPQSLRPYDSASFLTRDGLTAVERFNRFHIGQAQITFLQPDLSVYLTLRAGAPGNELVQAVRGFLLGPPESPGRERMGNISGLGYRAADISGVYSDTPWDLAASMFRLNTARLDIQERSSMADTRTIDFHRKAKEFLSESRTAPSRHLSLLRARDSATFSTLVHPILRQNISDAVISIVWYLGLLVPFVFFFERLLFGITDIRKQLIAQSLIFLAAFLLLKLLHPAFGMIRSSLMILLGFVILLISVGITILFAGKFRENLVELTRSRGRVTAAEADTIGILVTAFMLGLSNLHRRKVRTGLTCATLVLITFAMIAFTSVRSDLVDTEVALGPASYQGMLIKNENLAPVREPEIFALQTKYGYAHKVAPRSFFTGTVDYNLQVSTPELEITHESEHEGRRSLRFGSILRLSADEPLAPRLGITGGKWFPPLSQRNPNEPPPVILPIPMAEALGLRDPAQAGPARVRINGGEFLVIALFDPAALEACRDLDDSTLLPFAVQGMVNIRRTPDFHVLAGPDEPRIPARDIVLMSDAPLTITVPGAQQRVASVAVVLNGLDYRTARQIVISHLEQTGTPTFFGLDGVRYLGSRTRQAGFEGLLDLLIPLVIASLTVLNTMKGSVYERRDEIFVYNAVGIAPRYIFFMFIAEAFVYAVMGAVLGYFLAQGAGALLTALGLTGGLNMTFAGLNSIYASLAVMAAVFISTYFPARSAMEIASPAENSGWTLPEPEGETLAFNLPFTFHPADRLALLAFFSRYLRDHGEGGAGFFFAAPPAYHIARDPRNLNLPSPSLCCDIWLKPFDLGVSQNLHISLPHDKETGEFIAHISIRRVTGTREAWLRLNRPFVSALRRQFLHWRAVNEAQKKEFLKEAVAALEGPGTTPAQPQTSHV